MNGVAYSPRGGGDFCRPIGPRWVWRSSSLGESAGGGPNARRGERPRSRSRRTRPSTRRPARWSSIFWARANDRTPIWPTHFARRQDGDVIELRFNGRLKEGTLALGNHNLTIQAAEGFRPVVAFQPDEFNPINHSGGMFALTARRVDVERRRALELDVPRGAAAGELVVVRVERFGSGSVGEVFAGPSANAADQQTVVPSGG